ncbi:hypothetical protein FPOAC2_08724 [Fusarium poae]|uniref:hypothetical protein n=1 Tax=Fusarium poae TaxID=36050 RepID=UPI001CE73D00|nr:hypothetical protein FPOAC1_008791 [Fusarium poae]KAG8669396.1 hypothetical protein FPOAC1_008791 [Fusarium poae]
MAAHVDTNYQELKRSAKPWSMQMVFPLKTLKFEERVSAVRLEAPIGVLVRGSELWV